MSADKSDEDNKGNIIDQAVSDVENCRLAFCKFLSANDTGETGAHQAGIYIAKQACRILFDQPGEKGINKEQWVTITWQGQEQTRSRFLYYGKATRDEYRITNFGRGFPFLRPVCTGALFLLIRIDDLNYKAYVFNSEDEINEIAARLNINIAQSSYLLGADAGHPDASEAEASEEDEIKMLISSYAVDDFPDSRTMSLMAQDLVIHRIKAPMGVDPDNLLGMLVTAEYQLFRAVEEAKYMPVLRRGFVKMEDFLNLANTILNRRKSRAGKSLEHHLAVVFDAFHLSFGAQVQTEGNKRPDFLFPSGEAYHDPEFPAENLITLAVKTTCKDRWRQILNEADRTRNQTKYLLTLQQGISSAQLQEMAAEKVQLIVPREYITFYPPKWREQIWSLSDFIRMIQDKFGGSSAAKAGRSSRLLLRRADFKAAAHPEQLAALKKHDSLGGEPGSGQK